MCPNKTYQPDQLNRVATTTVSHAVAPNMRSRASTASLYGPYVADRYLLWTSGLPVYRSAQGQETPADRTRSIANTWVD